MVHPLWVGMQRKPHELSCTNGADNPVIKRKGKAKKRRKRKKERKKYTRERMLRTLEEVFYANVIPMCFRKIIEKTKKKMFQGEETREQPKHDTKLKHSSISLISNNILPIFIGWIKP